MVVGVFECLSFVVQVLSAAHADEDFDDPSCVEIDLKWNQGQASLKRLDLEFVQLLAMDQQFA